MILAVNAQDLFIIAGTLAAAALGILGAVGARLMFVKAGLLLAAVAIGLGLFNFGWKPLFGGSHPPDTYFGATMLLVGLLGAMALGAVEESHRRMTSAADPGRAFPVIASPRDPSA
jgi:hypothetical protein